MLTSEQTSSARAPSATRLEDWRRPRPYWTWAWRRMWLDAWGRGKALGSDGPRVQKEQNNRDAVVKASFPTCQVTVRVVAFYVSCLPASSSAAAPPPAPDGSVSRRTSNASAGWQCSPPDLKRQLFVDYIRLLIYYDIFCVLRSLEIHLLARMLVTSGSCVPLRIQLFLNRLGTQATSHSKSSKDGVTEHLLFESDLAREVLGLLVFAMVAWRTSQLWRRLHGCCGRGPSSGVRSRVSLGRRLACSEVLFMFGVFCAELGW